MMLLITKMTGQLMRWEMTDKENRFEKDINVPGKEQIICHGVNVICENCGKQFNLISKEISCL